MSGLEFLVIPALISSFVSALNDGRGLLQAYKQRRLRAVQSREANTLHQSLTAHSTSVQSNLAKHMNQFGDRFQKDYECALAIKSAQVLVLECLVGVLQAKLANEAYADLTIMHTTSDRAKNQVLLAMNGFAERLLTANAHLKHTVIPKTKTLPTTPDHPTYLAKFDFHAQKPEDLSFEKGQIIIVVKKTSSTNDWWLGCIGDKYGTFPANYVEIDTEFDNQGHLNGGVFVQKSVALWNFDGQQPGDLCFLKGQIVEVTKKTDSPFGWWHGRIGERKGIFPGNYVNLC